MKKLKQLSDKIKENIDLLIESETEKKSTLSHVIVDMKNRILVAKGLIGTAIAEIERLKLAYKNAIDTEEKWRKIVDSNPIENEKTTEARQYLQQQQQLVNYLEKQIQLQETLVTELKTKLTSYHRQFKGASKRVEQLSQQQKQAELRAEFYQLLAESDQFADTVAFEQAELELKEAEAKAKMWEERNQQTEEKTADIEDKFDVDQALAALKKDILGSSQDD